MYEEFEAFKKSYPKMKYIEVKPLILGEIGSWQCKVQKPNKKDFLQAIVTAIQHSYKSNYIGLYFSGSTIGDSGDWAVYDEQENITSISY